MATILYREDRETYEVRWKEIEVIQGPDGTVSRRWKSRRRQVPNKRAAERLQRDIEGALAVEGNWTLPAERPVATIGGLGIAYLAAMLQSGEPSTTSATRSSLLQPFINAYEDALVSELSVGLLRSYAATLPSQGRQAATRHRRILEIERMWAWGAQDRASWPGISAQGRITGVRAEVRPPPPVVAGAAPSWEEVDKMIRHLGLAWHRRAALVQRYTGLRVSQVLGIEWSDIDLVLARLRVRSAVRGAKGGRTRVLPLHAALVAEFGTWGPGQGLLFPRRYHTKEGTLLAGAYRGEVLCVPFTKAWEAAEVPRARWDVSDAEQADGTRGHGSPTHAIRRCVRAGLLRLGVEEAVALYLIGHSSGTTAAAYVPEDCPEQSPWWPRILAAVAMIPEHPR